MENTGPLAQYIPENTERRVNHEAEEVIPKDMLLFCQPEDEPIFRTKGFKNVIPIEKLLIEMESGFTGY